MRTLGYITAVTKTIWRDQLIEVHPMSATVGRARSRDVRWLPPGLVPDRMAAHAR
jgi:hypothetical protein